MSNNSKQHPGLASMTAFSRLSCDTLYGTLTCELKSVNSRYLDISIKSPEHLRVLDIPVRTVINNILGRGKVECLLRLTHDIKNGETLQLNEDVAGPLMAQLSSLAKKTEGDSQLDLVSILRWPGILKTVEIDAEVIKQDVLALVTDSLNDLIKARQSEGQKLCEMIGTRCQAILGFRNRIQKAMPEIMKNHRTKLLARIKESAVEVDESRLEQELVYLAQRMDVAEELDRLSAHIEEVENILGQSGRQGRRLDFLMQEINREVNTLGSKSMDIENTRAVVEMKVLIEEMREQIQNIE